MKTRWRIALGAAIALLVLYTAAAPAEEGHSRRSNISISSASWSNANQRLSASGSNAQRRSTVTITYYGDNTLIGTTRASRRGSWSGNFYNLNPVPCRIRATDGSGTATRSVSNAPSNCSDNGAPANQPPVADAGGPYSGTAGAAVSFNGSGSSDPDGSIASYSWTFGDGSTGSGVSPSHTYTSAGTYTVGLMVTDNQGATASASTTAAIQAPANQPPVADAGGPYTGTAGVAVSFNGSGSSDPDGSIASYAWTFGDGGTGSGVSPSHTYAAAGTYTVGLTVTDNQGATASAGTTATISASGGGGTAGPTARGDEYATPVGTTLTVAASRISGVLYNDFGGSGALTAQLVSGPSNGTVALNADGSFTYTPNSGLSDNDNDSFTYRARDGAGDLSQVTTVNIHILSRQQDFKILMNYELGMHCTGFEFAYCCVLPPYNSILAQVVKPQTTSSPRSNADFPRLLEGDPTNGVDALGRETVLRDFDGSGNFQKYYLEYYHDAQPRREGQGKTQTSTLISDVEGNSMLYNGTVYDSAAVDANGKLITGSYNGADGVVLGNRSYADPTDNYANGWLNHLYIYAGLDGANPNNSSLEKDKIRLGVTGMVEYPKNVGAALQPMGPNGNVSGFDNVLTFSGDTGTVVYTQMKVLENLPIMLTSPRIWEALGLPLTPFEDSIDFFADPGSVDEESIRPYVSMKAALHVANCNTSTHACTKGAAVLGSNGKPIIGFGTAPIDIPNCERCHGAPAINPDTGLPNQNSPNYVRRPGGGDPVIDGGGNTVDLEALTDLEISYWKAYYGLTAADSDWYPRLKGAAINMMVLHDADNGTSFTANYPATGSNPLNLPQSKLAIFQNTRLGHESVICQKCHADNVIAVVKSATHNGALIPPITEAIHWTHREKSEGGVITFADATGRSGGCQGCHPAHRSDGVMDGYPITRGGDNVNAAGDNRLASGGCFVGRDVHSNPMKDVDGAETPQHLNAVGQWLSANVFRNQAGLAGSDTDVRGLWCTNCHTQLSQEIWKKEDCTDLIHGDCITNPRGDSSLSALASDLGITTQQAINWLDPKDPAVQPAGVPQVTADLTHAVWDGSIADADVATIEVRNGQPYGTTDADGDFSVRILDFCTTPDCVAAAQAKLDAEGNGGTAVAVPFSAADDGRDHWLAAGEPHCADCHAAPYVEQSGNINAFPPFNYPRKASLMRYSRGHQDISCQGCHESIHGLYPVTPTIDATSYAQAASLNYDGSHGPLKCGTCHPVGSNGIPTWIRTSGAIGRQINGSFDSAVGWAHTFTDEASVLDGACQNCHGVQGSNWSEIKSTNPDGEWLRHAMDGRASRQLMDKAQIEATGHVYGDPAVQDPRTTLCRGCHGDEWNNVSCGNSEWRQHLSQGRVSEIVWEYVSKQRTGGTCGW